MSIDIAAPGAHLAALKAAIGDLTGIVKLASGTITTPVAYIDLALPAGYTSFELHCQDFLFSAADVLSVSASLDGGSTFISDNINYDSYRAAGISTNNGVPFLGNSFYDDSLIEFGRNTPTNAPFGLFGRMQIFPGSISTLFHVLNVQGGLTASGYYGYDSLWVGLNPAATAGPPTKARATTIRLSPYGNGDSPPTSGHTITAGSYILWGSAK